VNNNYADLRSNPDQDDDKDWITFSIILTDDMVSSNTLTQAPGSTPGNFYLGINPTPTSGEFNLSDSVQSGGEDYENSPAQVQWSISGSTATPSSGDLADGNSTDITLDRSSNNYSYVLTASAGNDPTLSGTATVDIEVVHADSISSELLTSYASAQGPSSTDQGTDITDSNVAAIPEDTGATFIATLNAAMPNTSGGQSKIKWAIQRNTNDILNGPTPTITQNPNNPNGTYLTPDSPGSFNVIAYADLAGTGQWQQDEILRVFHLAIVLLTVPPGGISNNSTPNFSAVIGPISTGFFSDGPNNKNYPAITITAGDYDLIGGGQDFTIGVDQIMSGWVQNVTSFTDLATYSPSGYGEYLLDGTLPILDYDPTAVSGPLYQAATGGPATYLTAQMTDAPSLPFDNQDPNAPVPNSLINAYEQAAFADYLDAASSDFTGVYASYAQTGWQMKMDFSLNNGSWSSAGSYLSSASIATFTQGDESPGVTTGAPADSLITSMYFAKSSAASNSTTTEQEIAVVTWGTPRRSEFTLQGKDFAISQMQMSNDASPDLRKGKMIKHASPTDATASVQPRIPQGVISCLAFAVQIGELHPPGSMMEHPWPSHHPGLQMRLLGTKNMPTLLQGFRERDLGGTGDSSVS
jgi:hypothetical protein